MRTFLALGLTAAVSATAAAQAPTPNPTNKTGVIGLMHAIHSTNDVEKTLAFYQSVFNLNGQVRSFDPKGPRVLTNSPTASLRVAMNATAPAMSASRMTSDDNVRRRIFIVPPGNVRRPLPTD